MTATLQTSSMGIAPPRKHLDLGDRIRYHHRVAVARWQTGKKKRENGLWEDAYPNYGLLGGSTPDPYWRLFEGASRHAYIGDDWKTEVDLACDMPYNGRRNKTLFIWPEDGEGVIIGMVRRGIGQSVSNSTSFNGESHEYEHGYFAEEAWVWIYAVKTHLEGTDYILVPMDAAEVIDRG